MNAIEPSKVNADRGRNRHRPRVVIVLFRLLRFEYVPDSKKVPVKSYPRRQSSVPIPGVSAISAPTSGVSRLSDWVVSPALLGSTLRVYVPCSVPEMRRPGRIPRLKSSAPSTFRCVFRSCCALAFPFVGMNSSYVACTPARKVTAGGDPGPSPPASSRRCSPIVDSENDGVSLKRTAPAAPSSGLSDR